MKTFSLFRSSIAWLLFTVAASAGPAPATGVREEVCLNGDDWTFRPVRRAFYGYELDSPGRWKAPQRSHRFITDALSDPGIDWTTKRKVRVPMSWSSATSDPGSSEAAGDFQFPGFWQYVHVGTYEREFAVPASFAGKRVKLAFESVNFRCWVYVNDKLVRGREEGGDFTHENKHPFEVDISALVKPGSAGNRLRVVVHDFTASFAGAFPNEDHPLTGGTYPLGDRCDYYNKDRGWRNIDSGIIGDVILAAVPLVNVEDVWVRTSVADKSLAAELTVRNEGSETRTFAVAASVTEWKSGRAVLSLPVSSTVTLAAGESRSFAFRQPWPEPRLWWPHDPFLYSLKIDLLEKGRAIGTHLERFGFREVRMVSSPDADKRGFYLNGVRVRLFGESVEPTWKDGYTEGVGTSGLYLYNPEYWALMISEAKRLNMTVLRPHRGMWLRLLFTAADERGMMMIAESTINNGNHDGGNGTIANQRRAVRDMVRTLRNHPSVVIWSLANESPFNEEWADEARLHDPTRPMVATQTKPRNHPSPSLAAATGSYAMGLSGYEPAIYGRHDANWKSKPMYIYEDNACYDQPEIPERIRAVQQGLTIFRGHRSTGYEIISTFYTWQKVYAQPRLPGERLLRITWTPEQVKARGYRPEQARMPLLDPWTDPARPRIISPVQGLVDPLDEFWQRTFSPVAVFDRDYDERRDVAANPYVAPLDPARTLIIHNDDLQDLTTAIRVNWTVQAFARDEVLSAGGFTIEVPSGGIRRQQIQLDTRGEQSVRVVMTATKSGRERFREMIYLGNTETLPRPAGPGRGGSGNVTVTQVTAGGGELVLHAVDQGVEANGYRRASVAGQFGPEVLVADPVSPSDFVEFHPAIGAAGEYDIYLHVPAGLRGTQAVEIRHDTLNTTMLVELSKPGWIRLNSAPLHFDAGRLQNSIRFGRGGTAARSVVDAVKLVRVR